MFLQRPARHPLYTQSPVNIPQPFPALLAVSICLLFFQTPAHAQSEVQVQATKVADNIYLLTGQGGNIGLCVGDDGAFVVDDQFAPLTDRILATIATITEKPVRFVINTHWHGDHTGGNGNMAEQRAIILAHENVRTRLIKGRPAGDGFPEIPGLSGRALPVVTFNDGVTFHWNGETISVKHVTPSHTDGDSFVIFTSANVIHTGDVYVSNGYPFIDAASGGTIQGFITNSRMLLDLADDETTIIPGHGPLANKADVVEFLRVLELAVARTRELKEQGLSLEEVQQKRPMAEFDADWGQGFMTPDRFIAGVYNSL